ncbi:NAD-dependent epimerase/dehydratase family protein [Streptomyces sp. NPDC021356]|uniref:NAD-dependent epimerase/dehydratase family protein n=1 Tax=Streptomyces sp. NPDC021356 TaxID=3154900 RepID=UPI0033E120A5
MPQHLLITGANGFIGRHVVRAALARPETRIRLVRHHGAVTAPDGDRVRVTRADLGDTASLDGLCRGVDTVVHCASRISGDEAALRAVNEEGTAALVADALRHGVRRIVYVSTAAVYGRGPFRGAEPHELPVRPRSATSTTRAAAERSVLAAGGTVLRPHLVYGTGDRWAIPGLALLIRHLGAPVADSGVHSAVEVSALAEAAVGAALADPDRDLAGAHHVNHPSPVSGGVLTEAVAGLLGADGAAAPLDPEQARARLQEHPQALHHLDMLTSDHWFASTSIWRLLGLDPGPEPARGLARHLPWYRAQLGSPMYAGR